MRAQEKGWLYFDKPVRDMLAGRANACRPKVEVPKVGDWHRAVYSVVTNALLAGDMNRDEVLLLLAEVAEVATDKNDLGFAISVCRKQGNYNIPYLAGVLKRERQKERKRTEDIVESRPSGTPWTPDSDHEQPDPETIAAFEEYWDLAGGSIETVKRTREHETQKRRRGA